MNKNFKIISINIILILNIILLFDWLLLAINQYKVQPVDLNWTLKVTPRIESFLPFDSTKRPIITIGDSYVFGELIAPEDTLAYKLQQITNRKTFNYGMTAQGIQHVLYKIRHSDFFKQKDLNPEYVVYIFIADHLNRMYKNYYWFVGSTKYLRYAKTNSEGGGLVERPLEVVPSDYIKVSYIGKKWTDIIYSLKSDNQKFNLYKLHIKEVNKALHEKYPDSKLVVIVYNDDTYQNVMGFDIKPFHTNRWDEIEQMCVKVINFDVPEFNFLNQRQYRTIDNLHPSGLAWDVLVPVVAKELNLI